MARVVVVGLGPAGADHLLPRARAEVEAAAVRFVRTARHPAVADLVAEGVTFTSFDHVYERASDLDAVYEEIADALVRAAREHGEVVYAVPGNPGVAERSVVALRARARGADLAVDVVAGLSFADLVWARLGLDPMGDARVVDGRDLDPQALTRGGPVVLAQLDDPLVLADCKVALLEHLPADAPVTVCARLGLADEDVRTVALADLDREVRPDHLTACVVHLPPGPADTFGALVALARRLRGPGGCPWDAEQTHHSLTRYVLEEAYEVVDAIEALPIDARPEPAAVAALADELGDLLFQVVFHGVLAEEDGTFTTADVAQGIHDKLVRRHPHVFGTVEVSTSGEVLRNWEQIKRDERGSESLVDSVAPGLPALLYVHKLLRKAATVGLDPPAPGAVIGEARAAVEALADGANGLPDADRQVGELLAAGVMLARAAGVDAESALRGWAGRYRTRFQRMEARARERRLDLHDLDPTAVDALWLEAAEEPR